MFLRPLIVVCMAVLFLSSCTRHQFFTVSSSDLSTNDRGLVMENDSLKIMYIFSGGSTFASNLVIRVYNKTPKPLFLDWSRSSLIINDQKVDIYQSNSHINLQTTTTTATPAISTEAYHNTSGQGQIQTTESKRFIPPGAWLNSTPIPISISLYDMQHGESKTTKVVRYMHPNSSIRQTDFTTATTPLTFKSYMTLYTDTEPSHSVVLQHSFWISEVIQARKKVWQQIVPTQELPFSYNFNNKLYASKMTGAGGVWTVFGLAAATVGVLYVRSVSN